MRYQEFIENVRERAGLRDPCEADRMSMAVLQALCDRLTVEEATDLLAQLPALFKVSLCVSLPAQPLSVDDLAERVAQDLAVSPDEARSRISAVVRTSRETGVGGELDDVLAQLAPDYADLVA